MTILIILKRVVADIYDINDIYLLMQPASDFRYSNFVFRSFVIEKYVRNINCRQL